MAIISGLTNKLSKNPKRIHNLFSGSKISGLISVINKNMTPKERETGFSEMIEAVLKI